jgi:hypothetical protein
MFLVASLGQKSTRGFIAQRIVLFFAIFCVAQFQNTLSAQQIFIAEFMAANRSGQQDEDGDYSDWIEIYNAGREPASLAGWFLTDNIQNLTQWRFPDVILPGQSFMLVFASGKDRTDHPGTLHTNFRLDREGEYLGLVRPDGVTVAFEFAPRYPRQLSNISYGIAMITSTEQLLPAETNARMHFPEDGSLGSTWMLPGFDDSGWSPVAMGIGYDRASSEPLAPPTDVTQPGDIMIATSSRSPTGEEVDKAIDNSTATKYLNFDKLNTGFTITPGATETTETDSSSIPGTAKRPSAFPE